MLSKLLLRVLGLVIVVPRLAFLPCPRLKLGVPTTGLPTGDGEPDPAAPADAWSVLIRDMGDAGNCTDPAVAIACSNPAETPFVLSGAASVKYSPGVVGWELMSAFPSSESASKSSGGRRSFSISDLRL